MYFSIPQVKSRDLLTLDPAKGERAMLVKDYHGDWGLCVAKWEGFRKGVPGIPGRLKHPIAPHPVYTVLHTLCSCISWFISHKFCPSVHFCITSTALLYQWCRHSYQAFSSITFLSPFLSFCCPT